nr:hypothetical protein [Tanacetum cinerariifolium]
MEEQSFIAIIHQKTNPTLLQFCLFSCFLSQVEPKKISDALQDPSWVEAMQKSFFNSKFRMFGVWLIILKGLLNATITLYLKVEDPILKEHQRCVQGKEALNILKDPRGDIMVLTSLPKRSFMPVSFSPPSIRMPTSLSKTVTRANDREKFHNVMRCLKTQSKFVKSLTFEALTLWARSRLHEGTNIFSWPLIICRNGLKRNRFPPMTPELFANILNLSSPDLVPLELS